MTTQPTTSKRWRPRFSLRTLVVLVTLVCCYAACWGPTKGRGVVGVVNYLQVHEGMRQDWPPPPGDTGFGTRFLNDAAAVLPLFVLVDEWRPISEEPFRTRRRYYFWFFVYVAKLPYERDVPTRP